VSEELLSCTEKGNCRKGTYASEAGVPFKNTTIQHISKYYTDVTTVIGLRPRLMPYMKSSSLLDLACLSKRRVMGMKCLAARKQKTKVAGNNVSNSDGNKTKMLRPRPRPVKQQQECKKKLFCCNTHVCYQ